MDKTNGINNKDGLTQYVFRRNTATIATIELVSEKLTVLMKLYIQMAKRLELLMRW